MPSNTAPGASAPAPWVERYWNVPSITAAMQTVSCRSSKGLSAGPAVQATSETLQPGPEAREAKGEGSHADAYSNFPQVTGLGIAYLIALAYRGILIMSASALTISQATPSLFARALQADGPAPDRTEKMALYGWLIGRWEMDAVVQRDDGSTYTGQGTIAFGWVLEGRAIQDVWVLQDVFHGTTLRVYDPGLDAWHILWSDPMRQVYVRQIARRAQGNDIVQEGRAGQRRSPALELHGDHAELVPVARRAVARSDGATWQLQAEFFARRVAD